MTDRDHQGVERPVTHPRRASPLRLDPWNGLSRQAALRYSTPDECAERGESNPNRSPGPSPPPGTSWRVTGGKNAPLQDHDLKFSRDRKKLNKTKCLTRALGRNFFWQSFPKPPPRQADVGRLGPLRNLRATQLSAPALRAAAGDPSARPPG